MSIGQFTVRQHSMSIALTVAVELSRRDITARLQMAVMQHVFADGPSFARGTRSCPSDSTHHQIEGVGMRFSSLQAPRRARQWVACIGFLVAAVSAHASLITNGNFETGTFAGWTQFTTANGTIGTTTTPGTPQITAFDTSGAGSSQAAMFSVASLTGPGPQEGGGIFQSFFAPTGQLTISLDIAIDRPSAIANAEGGVFRLLLDGLVVDTFATGLIAETTVRDTLSVAGNFGAGNHELRILITRPFAQSNLRLAQYVDNVVVVDAGAAVPEPATLGLLGIGLIGLLASRLRRG